MKKIFLGIVLVGFLATVGYGAEALVKEPINKPAHTTSIKLLNAVTTTGAGTSFWIGFLPTNHTWQVAYTGAATVVDVKLQGSIDDSTWFDLDTYDTATTPTMRHVVNKPVNYIRGFLTTFTNGTTMTVTSMSGGN